MIMALLPIDLQRHFFEAILGTGYPKGYGPEWTCVRIDGVYRKIFGSGGGKQRR